MSIIAGLLSLSLSKALALQGLALPAAGKARELASEAAQSAPWGVASRLEADNAALRVQLAEAVEHIAETERELARITEERDIWRSHCGRQQVYAQMQTYAAMVNQIGACQSHLAQQASPNLLNAVSQGLGCTEGVCNCVPARHDMLGPRR